MIVMAVVSCPECSDKFEVSSDKLSEILQCPSCFHQFFFMTPQQQAAAKKRQNAVKAAANPAPTPKPKKAPLTHEQKVEKLLSAIEENTRATFWCVTIVLTLIMLGELSGIILYFQLVD